MRPFTSPTSTSSVRPAAMSRTACAMSSDTPRSLAKWLSVPSGSTPSAMPVPASTDATALTVPSPPPATMSGGLARASRNASSISSAPVVGDRIFALIPASRNKTSSLAAWSAPWPTPEDELRMTGMGFGTRVRPGATLVVQRGRRLAYAFRRLSDSAGEVAAPVRARRAALDQHRDRALAPVDHATPAFLAAVREAGGVSRAGRLVVGERDDGEKAEPGDHEERARRRVIGEAEDPRDDDPRHRHDRLDHAMHRERNHAHRAKRIAGEERSAQVDDAENLG